MDEHEESMAAEEATETANVEAAEDPGTEALEEVLHTEPGEVAVEESSSDSAPASDE